MNRILSTIAVELMSAVIMAGFAIPKASAETVGEQFRKVLAQIDTNCRYLKMGRYLDPSDHEYQKKRRATDCNILDLEPHDWRTAKMVKLDSQAYPVPEHWLSTPQGRFAHSIKLPASIDLIAEDTSQGDGSVLFKRLCDRFAGEFTLKQVTNIEGLLQARPIPNVQRGYLNLVFWTKEKGGIGNTPEDYLVQPPIGRYEFLEAPIFENRAAHSEFISMFRIPESASKRSIHAQTTDGRFMRVPYIVEKRPVGKLKSQFAFTWRGIWPDGGLEQGIEGAELIVYRIAPFEVLGVRRTFMKHGRYSRMADPRLTRTAHCDSEDKMSPHQFIASILVPANP